MGSKQADDLTRPAKTIRLEALKAACAAGGGHVAPAFSIAEIMSVLYFQVLRVKPEDPKWPDRDRFILSKGHACLALYVALAERGFFPKAFLETYGRCGCILCGHPSSAVPGVELSTGSLGHGLSVGAGMALAAKKDKKDYRTIVLLGDGECQEGSVWEAAMVASQLQLDNLVAIVDSNGLQGTGRTEEIVRIEPLVSKWQAFGWDVLNVDGHSTEMLSNAFASVPVTTGKPTAIVARTIKGKGVSFMENKAIWHYRIPAGDELAQAIRELEG